VPARGPRASTRHAAHKGPQWADTGATHATATHSTSIAWPGASLRGFVTLYTHAASTASPLSNVHWRWGLSCTRVVSRRCLLIRLEKDSSGQHLMTVIGGRSSYRLSGERRTVSVGGVCVCVCSFKLYEFILPFLSVQWCVQYLTNFHGIYHPLLRGHLTMIRAVYHCLPWRSTHSCKGISFWGILLQLSLSPSVIILRLTISNLSVYTTHRQHGFIHSSEIDPVNLFASPMTAGF
jgi:hypothetical protein